MRNLRIPLGPVVGLALVGYLAIDSFADGVLWTVVRREFAWGSAADAALLIGVMILTATFRWKALLKSMNLNVGSLAAFNANALGCLFGFLPLGFVGSDASRAVLLTRQGVEGKSRLVASILIDRIVGIHSLLLICGAYAYVGGYLHHPVRELRLASIAVMTLATCTTIGLLGVAALGRPLGAWLSERIWVPQRVKTHVVAWIASPRLESPWTTACEAYGWSLASHVSIIAAMHCVMRMLPGDTLAAGDSFFATALSQVSRIVPLTYGPLEYSLDFLYRSLPAFDNAVGAKGRGLVVAWIYRLLLALVCAVLLAVAQGVKRLVERPAIAATQTARSARSPQIAAR